LREIFLFDLTPHVDSKRSGRIMAPGSTQPPKEMSTRSIGWG